jgi:hypothetical protein
MGYCKKPAAWLLLLALAGCGTYSWYKAGASDQDFKQDADACDKSRSNDPGSFDTCMTGKGWRLD